MPTNAALALTNAAFRGISLPRKSRRLWQQQNFQLTQPQRDNTSLRLSLKLCRWLLCVKTDKTRVKANRQRANPNQSSGVSVVEIESRSGFFWFVMEIIWRIWLPRFALAVPFVASDRGPMGFPQTAALRELIRAAIA